MKKGVGFVDVAQTVTATFFEKSSCISAKHQICILLIFDVFVPGCDIYGYVPYAIAKTLGFQKVIIGQRKE